MVAVISFYMDLIPAKVFYPIAIMGGLLGIGGGGSFLFYYFKGSDRWVVHHEEGSSMVLKDNG